MKKPTYAELLKDPRWQKKRLKILNQHKWTCDYCDDKTSTLHVHHGWYQKGFRPWDYADDQYHVLCDSCHEEAEEVLFDVRTELSRIKPYDYVDLLFALVTFRENMKEM